MAVFQDARHGVTTSGAAPGSWVVDAACAGLDPVHADRLFFPERGEGQQGYEAKAICAGCPVRFECLDFALTTNQLHGIWGGFSPKERRRLRRARGLTDLEHRWAGP